MSELDLRPTPGGRWRINPMDRIEWYDRKTDKYLTVCDEDAHQLRDLLNVCYPVSKETE